MSDASTTHTGYASDADRTVTAFFDSQVAADKARADLIAAGLSPDMISVAGGNAAVSDMAPTDEGFWHALKEFFMPDEDRFTYAEGLRRGGYALSVRTGGDLYDRALDILDADGAVDIDERQQAWRSEGWSGYRSAEPGADDAAYRPASAGTAGFGASFAGEDGYAPTGSLTTSGTAEAESRGDSGLVGTGAGEPGLLNPDMRERIGSGTASMTPPTPTGPQDSTLDNNAANRDRGTSAYKSATDAEDAALGSPTRTGTEMPGTRSTIGSTNDDDDRRILTGSPVRRDDSIQRSRVRGYIIDPADKAQSGI